VVRLSIRLLEEAKEHSYWNLNTDHPSFAILYTLSTSMVRMRNSISNWHEFHHSRCAQSRRNETVSSILYNQRGLLASLLAFHSLLNFISMRGRWFACHVGSPLRWGCGVWCHAKPRGCSSKKIQYKKSFTKKILFSSNWHFLSVTVQFMYSKLSWNGSTYTVVTSSMHEALSLSLSYVMTFFKRPKRI
jgi:hypothetical protein